MDNTQYIHVTSTDPAFNLALEEYVFDRLPRDRQYFFFWQNQNAIIIGKHQNTLAEINEMYVQEHGIRVVRRLSGGNVQKILIGREILAQPNVLVTAYPVRGLDINSSYLVYDIINRQKVSGVGVLFVGEDLDVMLALCDKIMVLCHGKVMGVVHAHKTSKEELGLMMTGALDLTNKYEDKPAGIAKDSHLEAINEEGER